MYRCKPSKWILPAIVGAGLPLLGAWMISAPSVSKTFAASCSTALSSVKADDWAKCETNGLNAKIVGEAPDAEFATVAQNAVSMIPGARAVEVATTLAPPLPVIEPAAPIAAEIPADGEQTFAGKWPSAKAKTLELDVSGVKYELGKSPELAVQGDDWSLNLGKTLTAGNYELVQTISDGRKNIVTYPPVKFAVLPPPPPPVVEEPKVEEAPKVEEPVAVAEPPKVEEPVKVEAPPPPPPPAIACAAPTVDRVTLDRPVTVLMGSWDSANSKRLRVAVPAQNFTAKLGDGKLTTAGDRWSLFLDQPLGPGSYDINATCVDGDFHPVADATSSEVIVFTKPTAAAPVVMMDHNPPTVDRVSRDQPVSVLMGSWDSKVGKRLRVNVPAQNLTAKLGDGKLNASGDRWSLILDQPLGPGSYDVNVTSSDADYRSKSDATSSEVIVYTKAVAAPPVTLVNHNPPTVDRVSLDRPVTVLMGTWDSTNGKRLRVNVPVQNLTAKLGDGKLNASGDRWSLFLDQPLGPGSYDVNATSSDADYISKSDATSSEIIVYTKATAAPPIVAENVVAPTIDARTSSSPISAITGTWDSANAKRLRVNVPSRNISAKLGDGTLTSEGNTWKLALAEPLTAGVYEVMATSSDAEFRRQSDGSANEIRILEVAPEAGAPTVDRQSTNQPISVITGTWDSKNAKRLRVIVPIRNTTYRLGAADSGLTADGDTWSLALAEPLGPGSYEVNAWTADGDYRTKTDGSNVELIVGPPPSKPADAIAPLTMRAPTINSMKSKQKIMAMTGRWDSANAKRMRVSVAGQSARLGQKNLMVLGDAWTWVLDKPLEEGSYEAVVTTSDDNFRPLSDTSSNELMVMAPPPPEPAPEASPAPEAAPVVEAPKPIVSTVQVPAARPIDCAAVLNRITTVFPIYFDVNKTDLKDRGSLAVQQYIALLKDPRCATLKVSISGHADLRGSVKFNQRLSDGRVATVMKALTDAGIAADRFAAKGFSELQPVDPARNEAAFAKNRRVDINVAQ
jgi:outer membrane protein OmpA-like peptidoglycan-associated protein